MFTGIVQSVGTVRALEERGGDWRLTLDAGDLDAGDLAPGDSLAVSGPCLTVSERLDGDLAFDVSAETVRRTALAGLGPGSRVNLEKALLPSTPIGGHFVTGHVDGIAVLRDRRSEARSERFVLELPEGLARYVAEKGAITLDGVSLTVNEVSGVRFGVNLVPHTLAHTNLGDRRVGERLNVEVDLLARYLERLLEAREGKGSASGSLDATTLARAGFPVDRSGG